ncbi:hypothetical protein BH10PLA1_BH10PLA1_10300 [soil metagenome]
MSSRSPSTVLLQAAFQWLAAASLAVGLLSPALPASGDEAKPAATVVPEDANAYDAPPPNRPLPVGVDRPMQTGPAIFVDATKGNDAAAGSLSAPFKTITFAITKLKPGDTLYLRGGTYYEQLDWVAKGLPGKPITVRAYPRELAIIDGGLPEFVDRPEAAWEPVPNGADGEYQSTHTFDPQGDTFPINRAGGVNVQGHFADSMVPLHGYWSLEDLRSSNELWTLGKSKPKSMANGHDAAGTGGASDDDADDPKNINCGPGIAYDPETRRIHIRLAHTNIKGLGDANYRGQTDPRKLRLVISRPGRGSVLTIDESGYLNLQDLVLRGARGATIKISDSHDIDLDGLTVYTAQNSIQVSYTSKLHANNCAFRGIAAPWTFRSSLKYRSVQAHIIAASGWQPLGNADFEFEHCDFTDCTDGLYIGNVHNLKFHHNFMQNICDDCFLLTATTAPDGTTPGRNIQIYQNYISRSLTVLAFGVGKGRQKQLPNGRQTGSGVWFYRNVVDNRDWIPYFPHREEDDDTFDPIGRMQGDHGSPTWEPIYFYNNTIISGMKAIDNFYLSGMARAVNTNNPRRLFNNIAVQVKGMPGVVMPALKADLLAEHNLHWSVSDGPTITGDFLTKFRGSSVFRDSQTQHAPGWTANDIFGDPKFTALNGDPRQPLDVTLQPASPAVDAGMPLPGDWPDPLRDKDKGTPDLGAIPLGGTAWTVGAGDGHLVSGANR